MSNIDAVPSNTPFRQTVRFLKRREAAEYLTNLGIQMSTQTLAQLAWRGGGPTFHRFGRHALYRVVDIDSWVAERLNKTGN